ncbi:hypothetical protein [Nocardia sp. NPDC052566]|uniref:hypothetical protein n=1 Tax=Nocardia sp. NPDC052566 TaxID=3364330 RepID=UPI0037C87512
MPPPNNRPEAGSNNGYGGHRAQQDPSAGQQAQPAPAQPSETKPDKNRPEASSDNGFSGHQAQQNEPAANPLGPDVPTYNPSAPGLLPAAPEPAHTLTGYDPSTGTRTEIYIPEQKQAPASTPYPASKARLDDVNGQPRYAVLNAAGEFLFVVDGRGNQIGSGSNGLTQGNGPGGVTLPTGTGNQAGGPGAVLHPGIVEPIQPNVNMLATTVGVGVGSTVMAGVLVGAEGGAVAGPVGALAGATLGLLAGLTVVAADQLIDNLRAGESEDTPAQSVDLDSLPTFGDPNAIVTPVFPRNQPTQPSTTQTPANDPNSTTRPGSSNPADDPNTSHQRITFPSTVPGQPDVPIEGTYWSAPGVLRNGRDNPRGQQPGSFPPKGDSEISLKAKLFKLYTWTLADIDEQYRPPVLAIMGFLAAAQAYQGQLKDGIQELVDPYGVKVADLTTSSERLKAAMARLGRAGAPVALIEAAVNAWQATRYPVDKAKERLGLAGAVALLKSDDWDVNVRPGGDSKHDIVAFKDGQLMVVESKGGDPGPAKAGDALVPDGHGGEYRAQQMTDPYLWHKLKQDAETDPEFEKWLIDRGMWDAVQNEDPTNIGYRLLRTDTNGKIDGYGSTQEKLNDNVPDDVEIGRTTGNRPGIDPADRNPGPTLRGIALPIGQDGNPIDNLLGQAGTWLNGLVHNGLRDAAAVPQLTVTVPPLFALPQRLWPQNASNDRSLTVTISTPAMSAQITQAEEMAAATYL